MGERHYVAEILMGNASIGAITTDRYGYQFMYDSTEVMNTVLRHMGFRDIYEYIGAYHGSFIRWHYPDIKPAANTEKELFICDYCLIGYIGASCSKEDDIVKQARDFIGHIEGKIELGTNGTGMFMLPLEVNEVKKCLGFTKVPKSEMWYCIDWKG